MPSKRFILIVLSVGIAGAAVWFAIKPTSQHARNMPQSKKAVAYATEGGQPAIPAGRALGSAPNNWQETLSTVAENRSFSDSAAAEQESNKNAGSGETNSIAPDTVTGSYIQNILSYVMSSKSKNPYSPIVPDKQTEGFFANQILRTINSIERQNINIYTLGDVKTSDTINERDYFNNIAGIINNRFPDDPLKSESEISIIASVAEMQTNSEQISDEELAKLAPYASNYRSTALDLLQSPAPRKYREFHVALANSFHNTGIAIGEIAKLNSDPIMGMLGLAHYMKELRTSQSLIKEIKNIFADEALAFEPSEPAFLFETYVDNLRL